MATLSSPGIGSGLDVNGIVTKLMAVESQPLTALDNKEASYQAKLSAFGSLSGALGSFQSALAGLTDPAKFQAVTATSADTTIITGSATSKAIAGTYNVNVTQLAQAQTIATAGQTTSAAAIGDGMATTLTFQFGAISGGTLTNGVYSGAAFSQDANQASGSVVIDSSNNSLQGIRDAVNKAGIGVTATIVSDGSATPNHLVFTSTKTGASSSMKISVARNPLDPADPSLADVLAYDPAAAQHMTQSSAAQSTKLTVNGIDVTSSTSTVNEAIQGVTLSAAKIGSTTISVAQDSTAVKYSINSFVKTYNDLDSTIKGLTGYDPKTQKAGLLNGDSTVREIQTQIRNMLSSKLSDSGSGLATLSQIGLSFNKDGSMALDSTKLQTAITSNIGGIGSLFATVGTTSDSLVSFVSSTSATQPGSNAINISTLARQGTLTGSAAPANLTITAGSNDQLELVVDGVSTTIKLAPSTYTANGLVAALQSSINGATAFSSAGIAVSVSVDGSGKMSITSNRYGSASNVGATGNGLSNLLGTPVAAGGIDVAGTINGLAATGSGQTLSGALGSATEGLKLQVTGGLTGPRGSINMSQGYAYKLNKLVDNYVGTAGLIAGKSKGINSSIDSIGKSRDSLNLRLAAIEKRYRAQFNALDAAISSMNSTSTFLTQQLAQLSSLK